MLDRWVAGRIGCADDLPRADVEAWQLSRINETVSWARVHSAFYRERLPKEPLNSLAEFSAYPLMTQEDLRRQGMELLCIPARQVARIVTLTTSGSTGAPKRICFTAQEQENTVEYFQHGMAEFVFAGERVMSLFPGDSPGSLNDLLSRALLRLGTTPVLFGYPAPERQEELLRCVIRDGIDFLVGPPGAIAAAARLSRELELAEQVAGRIRGVLLASEYVPPDDRALIGALWQCRVDEHYSMTETGLAGAVGCCVPGGYHVWESDLYYEIIDPETLAPCPPGERGEIVVTTLNRRAMPFIRYRTGDHSRFLPGACPCGSRLLRLGRVEAREEKKVFAQRRLTDDLSKP